jgi:hypothetical protein
MNWLQVPIGKIDKDEVPHHLLKVPIQELYARMDLPPSEHAALSDVEDVFELARDMMGGLGLSGPEIDAWRGYFSTLEDIVATIISCRLLAGDPPKAQAIVLEEAGEVWRRLRALETNPNVKQFRPMDIFNVTYHAGYWARGEAHDDKLGWLISEVNDEGEWPKEQEVYRVESLWRAGLELPPRWHRLDRAAAIRAWEEGVKQWGIHWYENSDGSKEDVVLQLALLGEIRYG